MKLESEISDNAFTASTGTLEENLFFSLLKKKKMSLELEDPARQGTWSASGSPLPTVI